MEPQQPRKLPALQLASTSLQLSNSFGSGRTALPSPLLQQGAAEKQAAAGPLRQPTVCSAAGVGGSSGKSSGSKGAKSSGNSGSSSSGGSARFTFITRAICFGLGAGGAAAFVSPAASFVCRAERTAACQPACRCSRALPCS